MHLTWGVVLVCAVGHITKLLLCLRVQMDESNDVGWRGEWVPRGSIPMLLVLAGIVQHGVLELFQNCLPQGEEPVIALLNHFYVVTTASFGDQ